MDRIAHLTGPRHTEVTRLELSVLGSGQALVRVLACGVCASESHAWEGPLPEYPATLGHEPVGVVEQTGLDVTRVAAGDMVTGRVGPAFADRLLADQDDLVVVPAGLSPVDAIGEPLGCVVEGLRRTPVGAGDSVAVVGAGYMGLLTIASAAGRRGHRRRDRPAGRGAGDGPRAGRGRGAGSGGRPDRRAGGRDRRRDRGDRHPSWAGHGLGPCSPARGPVDPRLPSGRSPVGRPGDVEPEVDRRRQRPRPSAGPAQRRDRPWLELVWSGRIEPGRLMTHRFRLEDLDRAFEALAAKPGFIKAIVVNEDV